MNIMNTDIIKTGCFSDLSRGDTFIHNDAIYMKITKVQHPSGAASESNAVNISNGLLAYFYDCDKVRRCICNVMVEENK